MWPERFTILSVDGCPKVHRYRLIGRGNDFGVYLHHFVASDEIWRMHDHPWRWAFAVVLAGGYREWRRTREGRSTSRWLGPGSINVLGGHDFHRVEIPDGQPAWTLFVHGPKIRRWGYLDLRTLTFELWSPRRAS